MMRTTIERGFSTLLALAWIAGAPLTLAEEASKPTAAAPKGSPRLNVYFMKGFEDATWQQSAFDRVAKGWAAAAPPALGKKAVVISTIGRDGRILEAKIGTESGSKAWDDAAVAAVRKASPFPALPKTWVESSLEVHWHFAFAK